MINPFHSPASLASSAVGRDFGFPKTAIQTHARITLSDDRKLGYS